MHISDARMWSLIHIPTGPTMCLNPTTLTVISRFDEARRFKCPPRLLPVLRLLQGPMLSPDLPSGAAHRVPGPAAGVSPAGIPLRAQPDRRPAGPCSWPLPLCLPLPEAALPRRTGLCCSLLLAWVAGTGSSLMGLF